MLKLTELLKTFSRSWKHHFGLQITTLLVLTSTFSIAVLFTAGLLNLDALLIRWGDSIQMTVFLDTAVTPTRTGQIQNALKEIEDFSVVSLVTQDQAKKEFSKQMENYAPELTNDPELESAFPASFQLRLANAASPAKLAEMATQIKQWAGVESVSYGQEWVESYSRLFGVFKKITVWLAAVLVLVGLLVVGNSIRVSISQRKDEIELLELVGATNWMVRKPFLFEGLLMGMTSSALSLIVAWSLFKLPGMLMSEQIHLFGVLSEITFLTPLHAGLVIFLGGGIGVAGSWFCLQELNDGWAGRKGKRA